MVIKSIHAAWVDFSAFIETAAGLARPYQLLLGNEHPVIDSYNLAGRSWLRRSSRRLPEALSNAS